MPLLERGNRLLAVDRFAQFETQRFQDPVKQQTVLRLILGDEKPETRLPLDRPENAAATGGGSYCPGRKQSDRDFEVEDRAFARFAVHADLAAH